MQRGGGEADEGHGQAASPQCRQITNYNLIMITVQARQTVNMGTGLTQIFITGEEASLEDISVASTEVNLAVITIGNKIMFTTKMIIF